MLTIDADFEQLTTFKWPNPKGSEHPNVIRCATAAIVSILAPIMHAYDIVLIDLPGRDDRAIATVFESDRSPWWNMHAPLPLR